MGKDTSKPIRFKTVQKNKKLGEFVEEEGIDIKGEEVVKEGKSEEKNKRLPLDFLEKLFKIKIGEDIFITGKIDRVDKIKNEGIEIIDYKTGRQPNENDLKKSLQLSIYALAATNPGLYNKKLSIFPLFLVFILYEITLNCFFSLTNRPICSVLPFDNRIVLLQSCFTDPIL